MRVTLYTREGCAESLRVWEMLLPLSSQRDFSLHKAASPEGAPSPCVRFHVQGAPFYQAEDLNQAGFLSYLREAEELLEPIEGRKEDVRVRQPGSLPSSRDEQAHPGRSFLWRHRVGGIVSALSVFLGLAWLAPLTASWGWGEGFYRAVHGVYRLVCDQVPERSAQLGGLPVCLCWRCTAIYLGSLLFGILYTVGRDHRLAPLDWLQRPVSLRVMLLFGLPLILDGASHALGWRAGAALSAANPHDFWLSWELFSADWWLRIVTSLLATVGAVKFLCPRLDKLGFEYERLYRARQSLRHGSSVFQ